MAIATSTRIGRVSETDLTYEKYAANKSRLQSVDLQFGVRFAFGRTVAGEWRGEAVLSSFEQNDDVGLHGR